LRVAERAATQPASISNADLSQLRLELNDLQAQIQRLRAENNSLRAQLAKVNMRVGENAAPKSASSAMPKIGDTETDIAAYVKAHTTAAGGVVTDGDMALEVKSESAGEKIIDVSAWSQGRQEYVTIATFTLTDGKITVIDRP
jgi:cell division protein FtsB